MSDLTNWAGNVTFGAARRAPAVHVDELRAVVAGADSVRALGHRALVQPDRRHHRRAGLAWPACRRTVRDRPGGADGHRGGRAALRRAGAAPARAPGYALPNLASLPHISVAGAVATGTHGSGDGNGNLATAVRGARAGHRRRRAGRSCAGAATTSPGRSWRWARSASSPRSPWTLRADLRDRPGRLRGPAARRRLAGHFDEVFAAGYSVSLFTDWTGADARPGLAQARGGDAAEPDRLRRAARPTARGTRCPACRRVNCTEQLGVARPVARAAAALPARLHPEQRRGAADRVLRAPRSTRSTRSRAVAALRDLVAPVLQISEIRTVAADDLWLSPAYRRDSVALHFTWVPDAAAVAPVRRRHSRPPWPRSAPGRTGARCSPPAPRTLAGLYPRLSRFRRAAGPARPGRQVPQRAARPVPPGVRFSRRVAPRAGRPGRRAADLRRAACRGWWRRGAGSPRRGAVRALWPPPGSPPRWPGRPPRARSPSPPAPGRMPRGSCRRRWCATRRASPAPGTPTAQPYRHCARRPGAGGAGGR